MKKAAFLIVILFSTLSALAGPVDSVGTKVKNGKIFIMHKVEKSEGLYGIARKYNVALKDLLANNPGADQTLHPDQIILVPTGKDAPFEEKVVKEYFDGDQQSKSNSSNASTGNSDSRKSTFAKYHTVQKGETLYSISVLYKTKVDVLKELNNLESTEIKEGMELLVPSGDSPTQQTQTKEMKEKVDSLQKEIKTTKQLAAQTNVNTAAANSAVNSTSYQKKVEKIAEFDMEKIWERGVAENYTIEKGEQSRVCSHHSAPIGTTIMVTNPSNKKAVFVKVVANHSMESAEGNDIIRLTQAAMDYIQLQEGKPVEISYAR
ncbi:MAG: LysM peptidoglycan-binding domain-containing protein [Bacteroidetes bacterium]|nr:LysM peptidoglycan-binding domain-containing protein [Bacteroidota bacterium]